MEVKFINPFISSVVNTMEMMLGLTPERKAPFLKENRLTQGDITGIVGFAEKQVTGSVALSFDERTALKAFSLVTGETTSRLSREVQDLIGELTNIVAGGAKTIFSEEDLSFHISIPSVVVGKDHLISHKVDIPVVVIPFVMEDMSFSVEVSMKELIK